MTVIDIDSHFYEPFDWLEQTDPELAALLPPTDKVTLVLNTAFGEVFSTLPPGLRPDPMSAVPDVFKGPDGMVTPQALAMAEGLMETWLGTVAGGHRPADRVAYLDAQGIDTQFVLPTFAFNPISFVRREKTELTGRILGAYNRWAAAQLSGHDRLLAVTIVDLKTMTRDEVLTELALSRDGGARSVLFWPSPIDGKSIAHPDFDWFWASCADLGLMPMVHVGASRPALDLGWLDNGRPFPSSLVAYLGQLHQIPQVVLTELVAAGIFERFPSLRVLVCELGIDWLPALMRRLDNLVAQPGAEAQWPYPLKPSEYIRRNVRVTPLPGEPAADVIEEVGTGVVVFSSDYPHPEGGSDAAATLRASLADLDPDTTADFFGRTIAADLNAQPAVPQGHYG